MQFEGEHKQIVLRGIERAGQDTMVADGAMNEVIGLDMRDGSYVPYMPTSENANLPKDTILIRHHHTSVCNNLIAVDKNLSLFFRKENSEAWQYVCQVPSAEIAFLGNTICTTQSGFYLLWQDSMYKKITKNNYPKVWLRAHDVADRTFFVTGDGWTDETRYKTVSSRCDEAGYLHQMHLCRYAIQLTDGSYCYISNPFLIQHPHARINRLAIRNGLDYTYCGGAVPYYQDGVLYCSELQYRLDEDFNSDEVLRVCVFLTKGFDMFNPITDGIPDWSDEYYNNAVSGLQGEDLYFKVYDIYPQNLKASSDWKGISLAGKLSDHLAQQDQLPIAISDTYVAEKLFVYNQRLHMINTQRKLDCDYRLDDFIYRSSGGADFEDAQVVASSENVQDYGNLIAIRVNGRMYTSNDIASGDFNLTNIARGHIIFYFADGTTYETDAEYSPAVGGIGNRTYLDLLNDATGNAVMQSPFRITVWYKSTSGEEMVSVNEGYYFKSVLYAVNPYLAVCSKNATRIVLEVLFDGVHYRIDKNLIPSATQNVAFYLDDEMQPVLWEVVQDNSFLTDGEKDSHEITHMVVSETGMPGVFDLETYRVGNRRKLVGVSFFSFDVTSDNFGNYPLVVFAEDGIFLMRIQDSGAYAYRTTDKISEDVCTNADTICRTNAGIVFGTVRGLMAITNAGVQEVMHHLIGEPRHVARDNDELGHGLNIYYCAIVGARNQNKISNMLRQISMEDVRELIQYNCHIEYDTHIGRLILWSPRVDYVYMIDVASGLTTKVGVSILMSDKEGGYYERSNY